MINLSIRDINLTSCAEYFRGQTKSTLCTLVDLRNNPSHVHKLRYIICIIFISSGCNIYNIYAYAYTCIYYLCRCMHIYNYIYVYCTYMYVYIYINTCNYTCAFFNRTRCTPVECPSTD